MALNCPVAHALHTRSTVADGVLDTSVPTSQVVQATQARALAVVLNIPESHAAQTRSVVGVLSAATKLPGAQTLTAAHTVAGLAS